MQFFTGYIVGVGIMFLIATSIFLFLEADESTPVSLEMDCKRVHYEADTERSIRLCMNDLERCYESWAGISCVPRGR